MKTRNIVDGMLVKIPVRRCKILKIRNQSCTIFSCNSNNRKNVYDVREVINEIKVDGRSSTEGLQSIQSE